MLPALRRALAPAGAALLLVTVLALSAPDVASAHAYLVRSAPEAGERLDESPAVLRLDFSEPFVEGSDRISLRRVDGTRIAAPTHVRRGTVVRQPLPSGLRGVVVVHWSVLADDGHPSLGEFAFAVGEAGDLPELSATSSQPTSWGQTAAVWLFFAGLALALGGLVSERFLWRAADVAAAPVGLGLVIAFGGALTYLLVVAADSAGGLAELAGPWDVAPALETRPGRLTALILALLAAAAATLVSRRGRPLAVPALLAAAVVSAARGHSGTSGQWWAVPADALHLAAAAVWIGALVHLVRVVYAAPEERRETLGYGVRRYASLAIVTVLVAIAAGLVTALAQFGSLDELTETSYGQTLLVKGALIGVALAVALAARTRALGLPWPEWGFLRRIGTFELASGAIVLLLLALLVGSGPVQLVSSLLFAGTLVVCAVAVRRALLASEGGAAALVVAGASGVLAINAGIVATGAAFFRPGSGAGDATMVGTRVALAAAAGGLAVGAVARALSRGGTLRLPLLRRLTTAETATLVGALAAASLLVNLAPPRAAVASAAGTPLGPPPLKGPAIRLAEFTGQIAVGLAATGRQLRFEIDIPGEQEGDVRLTAEAQPPGKPYENLYPRSCGAGCFTIRYRLPPGQTTVTAEVEAAGVAGGTARFAIPWPPRRDRPELLRRVARTMWAVPELELTELVVSYSSSARTPGRYRLPGRELLKAGETYRGGAVDVRVLGRDGGLTQLAFALPPSRIWYRMWIDERYRVRREVIVNRGHRITRTFRYPAG